MRITADGRGITLAYGANCLTIEPWGPDGARVRLTAEAEPDRSDWALTETPEKCDWHVETETVDMTDPWYRKPEYARYHEEGVRYRLVNGRLTVQVSEEGWLSFLDRKGRVLLREYWRNRDHIARYAVPSGVPARELKPIPGTRDFALTARFEADPDEHIYGMGQYQMAQLDKKGTVLDLEHRNTQASVPFYVSSLGYGFLWNDPAVGQVVFGENRTEWRIPSARKMDYYVVAGDTPADILERYTAVTGRPPMMPEYGLGFWQCKLRYRTQQEVLDVAREHKRRGLPLDVIVVDFFHWTLQGEWAFDPECFPDPEGMIRELRAMGVETAVSVWPTVDERSRNYGPMADRGYLIRTDRGGALQGTNWMGPAVPYDATHPGARAYVWQRVRENYYDKGVRIFWLDEAEPEYGGYEFDNWRYHLGPARQVTNLYPREYARGFWEGMRAEGQRDIISLVRCAWAGSQKYGALTWSGDVHSSFRAMREQLQAGLSMGMAGIPWWTCDLGGFIGGDPTDPDFRELMARWFAWGCFLPVFRLHGDRAPWYERDIAIRENGRQVLSSGAPNEVWSFGEENYAIMKRYLFIREALRPYIRETMRRTSQTGEPVMRPLFFDFPDDPAAWRCPSAYMFGRDLLVSPVTEKAVTAWDVYLPAGEEWTECATGKRFSGGQAVSARADIATIPVFARAGSAAAQILARFA